MPEFHAEFHQDDLTLVFLNELVARVVAADDDIDETEVFFLGRLCPPERLVSAGFQDALGQPTERYHEALRMAMRVLPSLALDDKRVLVDELIAASLVDGHLHPRETQVVFHAARMLGMSDDDLDSVLDSHPAINPIDPGDPESDS